MYVCPFVSEWVRCLFFDFLIRNREMFVGLFLFVREWSEFCAFPYEFCQWFHTKLWLKLVWILLKKCIRRLVNLVSAWYDELHVVFLKILYGKYVLIFSELRDLVRFLCWSDGLWRDFLVEENVPFIECFDVWWWPYALWLDEFFCCLRKERKREGRFVPFFC